MGIDNFDGFYPRAMKERNLREMGRLPGFAFHEQDMRDVVALQARLTPETVIVHLAARAGVRPSLADPVGYADMNVTGTAAVLEAARRAGVSRIAFGSSSSVYGDSTPVPFREDAVAVEPVSPYAATKRAGELFLSAVAPIYGFRSAALRFFTVYGPRQRPDLAIHAFARRMAEGEVITLFGDGTQSRDYTYCDDIVAGVVAAVDWTATAPDGMEPFNLGREPLGADRRHAEGDRHGDGARAHDPVGADAAGGRPADGRRSDEVRRGARLRARRRRSPRASGASSPGSGRPMAGQTERLLGRARDRFTVQDYYGAIYMLEEIVASGRAFADVHHLIGVSLSLLGRSEEALTQFTRALELNPRYLEALIHQGLVLSELGRSRDSEEAFRRAADSIAPPSEGLPAPVAAKLANQHAELADAYAEAGALDRAVEQYTRALELGPGFQDLRYRMARVMLEAGRPLEAREALEEVLRARPNFVDAQAALGLAHFLSGDGPGAREVWRSCLARRPENARVEAYLAMLGRTGA